MANTYFNFKSQNEFDLYRKMQDESVEIFGVEAKYLPRTYGRIDELYQEDVLSSFDKSFDITVYVENYDSWGGEGDLYSKFGIELTDEVTLKIEISKFKSIVGDAAKEGDLIFFPLGNFLFEIMHVEGEEQPFYAFQQQMVYMLKCKPFRFEGENFNTGVENIDQLNDDELLSGVDSLNDLIEKEADEKVIDFSEDNPWGNF